MSCKHMEHINRCLDDLNKDQLERVKRIICSTLCNGQCKNEYLYRRDQIQQSPHE